MAMTTQQTNSRADLVSNSLGGDCLPAMTNSKSSPLLKMRRTLMDSYNETVRSAPKIGFGTAGRPPLNDGGAESPGPGAYQLKSTMFVNPSSMIRSPPSFTMRGREKFGSPDLKAIDRTCQMEPGPGHYKMAIVNPQEDNAPKYTFPKDTGAEVRENVVRAPGPGHYNIHPGVGKQVLSTKRSHAGVGFGTGNRPDLMVQSTADVGPGEYSIPGSTGERQVDSRKCNKSGAKFSKAPRMGKSGSLEDLAPGPGNYRLPPGICGRGAASPYPSAPAATLSGREKFGSPFGW
eukprot:g7771.t1